MKAERMYAIKQQALKALEASEKKNCPGVSMVAVTPGEALAMIEAMEPKANEDQQPTVP